MPAYNSQAKRIKNALKTLLSGIQYDAGSGNEPAFVSVLDNTTGEFDGYPSLRVLPGDLDTEKASVAENERTAAYVIYVHLPLEATPATEGATYDKMYDLTDLILDCLDEGDFDNSLTAIDSTIGVHFLDAQRGDWLVNDSKGGAILICRIDVQVRYSKNWT
jgi:hypothetical protein